MIFIFIVALFDAKTKVENMKIAVNVLEDEKRIQAQGKFYNIFDNDTLCKIYDSLHGTFHTLPI